MNARRLVALTGGLIVVALMASVGRADDSGQIQARVVPIGEFSVTLEQPKPVKLGKDAKIEADIRNHTGLDLTGVTATLHVDTSGLSFGSDPAVFLGDLPVGKTVKAKWVLRADETGLFVLVAVVEARTPNGEELLEESDAVVLEVVERSKG